MVHDLLSPDVSGDFFYLSINSFVSELANEYNVVASVNNYDYENMTNE